MKWYGHRVAAETWRGRLKLAIFYGLYMVEALVFFATLSYWRIDWPCRWIFSDYLEDET